MWELKPLTAPRASKARTEIALPLLQLYYYYYYYHHYYYYSWFIQQYDDHDDLKMVKIMN
jgi:hypothetical protein